jgi:hypothetical protein
VLIRGCVVHLCRSLIHCCCVEQDDDAKDDNDDDNNNNNGQQTFPAARQSAEPGQTLCFYNVSPKQSAAFTATLDRLQTEKPYNCSLSK